MGLCLDENGQMYLGVNSNQVRTAAGALASSLQPVIPPTQHPGSCMQRLSLSHSLLHHSYGSTKVGVTCNRSHSLPSCSSALAHSRHCALNFADRPPLTYAITAGVPGCVRCCCLASGDGRRRAQVRAMASSKHPTMGYCRYPMPPAGGETALLNDKGPCTGRKPGCLLQNGHSGTAACQVRQPSALLLNRRGPEACSDNSGISELCCGLRRVLRLRRGQGEPRRRPRSRRQRRRPQAPARARRRLAGRRRFGRRPPDVRQSRAAGCALAEPADGAEAQTCGPPGCCVEKRRALGSRVSQWHQSTARAC